MQREKVSSSGMIWAELIEANNRLQLLLSNKTKMGKINQRIRSRKTE
jgi:hypothetical protein